MRNRHRQPQNLLIAEACCFCSYLVDWLCSTLRLNPLRRCLAYADAMSTPQPQIPGPPTAEQLAQLEYFRKVVGGIGKLNNGEEYSY